MNNTSAFKDVLEKGLSVTHRVDTSWTMKSYHYHDAFEIYLALTDGVEFFIEDSIYEIQKGDLFVFNNTDLHKTVCAPETLYERYVVTFMPQEAEEISSPQTDLLECFLNKGPGASPRVHLTNEQTESLIGLFEKAIALLQTTGYGADIRKKIILAEILLFVNSAFRSIEKAPVRHTNRDYEKVKPVIRYILDGLNKDLSLDRLSKEFFISRYHLSYLFKKVTGFTVNEYVIHQRIFKACQLLEKNLPVSQVGEMVGFSNVSHFIRTFGKVIGTSPKQYLKKDL